MGKVKGLIQRLEALSLPRKFYERSSLDVAQALLGKTLHVISREGLTSGRIVETEAYRENDPASHSHIGKTPRTSIMFGTPGRAYVYFIYGMYEMLNFVTEPEGQAGAVLVRAVEPLAGENLMQKRRPVKTKCDFTNGPGKLCRAMGVRMSHNGEALQGPHIFVTESEESIPVGRVLASPRVGISKGTESLWRYFIQDSAFVSRVPENKKSIVFRKWAS